MPENETLLPDARTASRWQPLRDRVACGESPDEIFPDFQDQFYLALRRVFSQWKARRVDPKQLFEAALEDDSAVLRDLVNRTGNGEYAQLLQGGAAGEPNPSLEVVIRSFLDFAWEHVRGYLQIDCREGGVPDNFLKRVEEMLELFRNPRRT